jgi:hypothetical protein
MGMEPRGLALLSKKHNLSSYALTTLSAGIASNCREMSHYRRVIIPVENAESL